MEKKQPKDNPWRAIGLISAIGVDIVICMAAGYFVGTMAQNSFGGSPLWIVIGIIIGMAVGIASVYVMVKRYMGGNHE